MTPVQVLRIDLRRSGVDLHAREQTCSAYAQALTDCSSRCWEHFYRTLYHALQAAQVPAGFEEAAQSLLSILEDDLGVQLFDTQQLQGLRMKLLAVLR